MVLLRLHHGTEIAAAAQALFSLEEASLANISSRAGYDCAGAVRLLLRMGYARRRGRSHLVMQGDRVLALLRYPRYLRVAHALEGAAGRQRVERVFCGGGKLVDVGESVLFRREEEEGDQDDDGGKGGWVLDWEGMEERVFCETLTQMYCGFVRSPELQELVRRVIAECGPALRQRVDDCAVSPERLGWPEASKVEALASLNGRPWLRSPGDSTHGLSRTALLFEPVLRIVMQNLDARYGVGASHAFDLLLRAGSADSKELSQKMAQDEFAVRAVLNGLVAEGLVSAPALASSRGKQFAHHVYKADLESAARVVLRVSFRTLLNVLVRLESVYAASSVPIRNEQQKLYLHHVSEAIYADICLLQSFVHSSFAGTLPEI